MCILFLNMWVMEVGDMWLVSKLEQAKAANGLD